MTKKEKAVLEQLQRELSLLKAFRFTDDVRPDVEPPLPYCNNALSTGWLYNWYHGCCEISPACSTRVSHSFGSSTKADTQGARRLFSSKLLALRACRREAELKCAGWLAELDSMIESVAREES